jgi:hypothetical protein
MRHHTTPHHARSWPPPQPAHLAAAGLLQPRPRALHHHCQAHGPPLAAQHGVAPLGRRGAQRQRRLRVLRQAVDPHLRRGVTRSAGALGPGVCVLPRPLSGAWSAGAARPLWRLAGVSLKSRAGQEVQARCASAAGQGWLRGAATRFAGAHLDSAGSLRFEPVLVQHPALEALGRGEVPAQAGLTQSGSATGTAVTTQTGERLHSPPVHPTRPCQALHSSHHTPRPLCCSNPAAPGRYRTPPPPHTHT